MKVSLFPESILTLPETLQTTLVPHFNIRRLLTTISNGLLGVYAVLLIMLLVLRFTIGERWMLVALLNNNMTVLFLPVLPLLMVCLVLRRFRLAGLYVPTALFFVVQYVPLYLPQNINVPADALQIHILTYNLQAEEDLLDPMVAVIRSANADVVALQEMSSPAAIKFNAELADLYPYRVFYPEPNGGAYHGRGLLSRYPIIENYFWPVEYPIPVRQERAVLDVNGRQVVIYNFHAPPTQPIYGKGYDPQPRADQINALLKLSGAETNPTLMMGDFNTTDLDENYAHITALFGDTFREVGWGIGFTNPDWQHDNPRRGPSWVPMYQRIDYVFHDESFVPVEARVWSSSGGSDHRPLYVILALKP